jgi:hypothetical protein
MDKAMKREGEGERGKRNCYVRCVKRSIKGGVEVTCV